MKIDVSGNKFFMHLLETDHAIQILSDKGEEIMVAAKIFNYETIYGYAQARQVDHKNYACAYEFIYCGYLEEIAEVGAYHFEYLHRWNVLSWKAFYGIGDRRFIQLKPIQEEDRYGDRS